MSSGVDAGAVEKCCGVDDELLAGCDVVSINSSKTLSADSASCSLIRRNTRRPGSIVVSAS